ncbi:unnamed protein product [Hydatigera taeniaeformis]|uniref:Uncharacterized protein n=1 Tax=Hydatigena taeniaeformis TaxID=6205 RepID=A0A0R3WLM4_HYDTA|nr:unnamed protein product [Hydatigera taeniaeformis]
MRIQAPVVGADPRGGFRPTANVATTRVQCQRPIQFSLGGCLEEEEEEEWIVAPQWVGVAANASPFGHHWVNPLHVAVNGTIGTKAPQFQYVSAFRLIEHLGRMLTPPQHLCHLGGTWCQAVDSQCRVGGATRDAVLGGWWMEPPTP